MSKRDRERNSLGIKYWFNRIGIRDAKIQNGLKEMFLEDFEFNPSNIRNCRLDNAKDAFIQKNWSKFTEYVQRNHKFYIEIQYT